MKLVRVLVLDLQLSTVTATEPATVSVTVVMISMKSVPDSSQVYTYKLVNLKPPKLCYCVHIYACMCFLLNLTP